MKQLALMMGGSCLILIAMVVGFGWWATSPVNPQDQSLRSITVAKGETGSSIADQLVASHLIHSSLALRLNLKVQETTVIKAGTYELSPAMNVSQITSQLLAGPKDVWVTLLPGWRTEEVEAELVTKFGIHYFDPGQFTTFTSSKEGQLFPDTYSFPKQTNAETFVATLTNTFAKHYAQAVAVVGSSTMPREQVIVLASLVQREARDATSMRMVAGILRNRLDLGMPLQVDSTLQYAKGYSVTLKTWWATPRASDKSFESPFNTYLNKGLPPSPICNPGLDALEAALAPSPTEALFYLSDHQGVMHYAKTLAEQTMNVDRYLK